MTPYSLQKRTIRLAQTETAEKTNSWQHRWRR